MPVGTGILIAGGNDNIVEGNYIFDNWRRGTMLHWVPASFRGEPDPAKAFDTSNNNAYVDNCMGIRPPDLRAPDYSSCQGSRDANGVDFWWDEEEGQDCDPDQPGCVDTETVKTNCWSGNAGPNGGQPTSDPGVAAGMPRLRHRIVHVPGHQQAARAAAVRDLGPADQHGPARLRLVHDAARAELGPWRGRRQADWPSRGGRGPLGIQGLEFVMLG